MGGESNEIGEGGGAMKVGRASPAFMLAYRIAVGCLGLALPAVLEGLRTGTLSIQAPPGVVLYFAAPYLVLLCLSLVLSSAWTLVPPLLGVIALDIWATVEVARSESSTAALALVFVPVWQVVLAIPAGVLVGRLVEARARSRGGATQGST